MTVSTTIFFACGTLVDKIWDFGFLAHAQSFSSLRRTVSPSWWLYVPDDLRTSYTDGFYNFSKRIFFFFLEFFQTFYWFHICWDTQFCQAEDSIDNICLCAGYAGGRNLGFWTFNKRTIFVLAGAHRFSELMNVCTWWSSYELHRQMKFRILEF